MSKSIEEMKTEVKQAIQAGEVDAVCSFLSGNAELLRATTFHGTWLHLAAKLGNVELVQRLIGIGAEVNAEDEFGGTPIAIAAAKGHADVINCLLENGAETTTRQPDDNPIFNAIYESNLDIIRLFMSAGVDANVVYRSVTGNL